MAIRHVIVYDKGQGRVLVDRQTLAFLTQRSEHTIRAVCTRVGYRQGKAVYDLDAAQATLLVTPKRGRSGVMLKP